MGCTASKTETRKEILMDSEYIKIKISAWTNKIRHPFKKFQVSKNNKTGKNVKRFPTSMKNKIYQLNSNKLLHRIKGKYKQETYKIKNMINHNKTEIKTPTGI